MVMIFKQINLLNVDKFKQLHQLHNTLFSTTCANEEWMKWCFNHNVRAYGAYDNDRLIGLWCVERKKLVKDNKIIDVGRCFSVGVDPDYRRLNIFTDLSKFAISSEKEIGEFEYILGFPQKGRPVVQAHLNAGWEFVQEIDVLTITPTKYKNVPFHSVNQVDNFYDVFSASRKVEGSFFNSPRDLNHRWIKHPNNRYIIASRYTPRLECNDSFIVLKQYSNKMHVLDIHQRNTDDLVLLKAAHDLALRHACEQITIWCAKNDVYRSMLTQFGFVEGNESIDMLAVNVTNNETLNFESCHWSNGSEESL